MKLDVSNASEYKDIEMKILSGILLLHHFLFFPVLKIRQTKDILPENEMQDIMWDMIRADQYVAAFLSERFYIQQ